MGRRLATEVQGRRRAAARNVWRHARGRLLLPCPYSNPLELRLGLFPGRRFRRMAWAWAQRNGGFPSLNDGGGGPGVRDGGLGPGRRQGYKGQEALKDQGKKCLLVTGTRW